LSETRPDPAPIAERILPTLRADIVSGRWRPGERLAEPDLCAEFGISRTPLRDALRRLAGEGLVRLTPHAGAVVTPIDPPDLGEKLDVLAGLEQLAATRVAAAQDPAALGRLRRLDRAMADAAATRDMARYYALNDAFHRAVVTGAGNATLAALHETLMWHVHRARRTVNEATDWPDPPRSHGPLMHCILAGDADGAGLAMRRHLDDVARAVRAALQPT
jgi:DNA-binding GntR family transcriptional regulator